MNMDKTNITNSIVTSGTVTDSTLSNNISYSSIGVTAQMWKDIMEKADNFGRHGELKQVQELKTLLDQGKTSEAKPLWQTVKGFLSNFAEVSEIISAFDSLLK